MTTSRFEAYLARDRLCTGGSAEPFWDAEGNLVVRAGSTWRRVDLRTGAATPCEAPAAATVQPRTWMRGGFVASMPAPEMPSPGGQWLAFIEEGEIALRSARNGQVRRVTSGATPDCIWDIETTRYKLAAGMRAEHVELSPWRPDGGALFACRHDLSGVYRIPRISWREEGEEVDFTPYQKAGARIDRYSPHIVDVRSGTALRIDIGPLEDRYVQLLGWRPGGAEVLLVAYDRDMRRAVIYAADGETGSVCELMTERGDTFVRLQHETLMASAHGFRFLPDGSGFLWLSARDGWNHIHRYDSDGRWVGQLTSGDWPAHDIAHVTPEWVYFTAAHDTARPYDIHVCRVPLAGGEVQRLSREPGVHRAVFAPGGEAYLDEHSAVDRPLATELRRADGSTVANVSRMNISALESVGYRAAEEFKVTAADGVTELWGVMYKPADFDPARRYPLLEHIYGGPQVVAAAHHFSVFETVGQNLAWALAQEGFIVVCVDGRATPGRSKAFQDTMYGSWGQREMQDHAAAVRQLCERHPFIDAGRIGIIGHSWGAYYATAALMQHPDLYKVAVASSPGYIPRESILYEPYLGRFEDNRDDYEQGNLTRSAARLRGRFLLAAGTSEYGPFGDAMKMSRALIDAGVQHEFAILPGEFHSYTGAAARYFAEKARNFLREHLLAAEAAA